MARFNLLVLLAGALGYIVSIAASTAMVLLFVRLNTRMLPGGKVTQLCVHMVSPAPAIALGAATLSQAYLLRHAVFVIMSLVQDFLISHGNDVFAGDFPGGPLARLVALSVVLLTVLSILSVISIWLATVFFNRMTGEVDEMKEIESGNVSFAILYAFVLFAITVILNEGIEDFSRALVPYGGSGAVRLP
jgi:hypothetical protein